jgi:hypothetical protein
MSTSDEEPPRGAARHPDPPAVGESAGYGSAPFERPAPPPRVESSDQVLLTIGDIGVSRYWVVTPNGSAPLQGSTWVVLDMTRTEQKIPTWAIVLAIVFALACLLGLLFLLVKEEVTTGYVQVQVKSGNLQHATQVPVSSTVAVAQIRQQVSQAQSMAAALR